LIKNGVNAALAEKLGLSNLKFLSSTTGASLYELSVYVPSSHAGFVSEAIFNAGAGEIGEYAMCMNKLEVDGQFMPLKKGLQSPF